MLRKAMWASVAAAAVGLPVAAWQSDNIRQYAGLASSPAAEGAAHSPAGDPPDQAGYAPGYDPTRPLSPQGAPLPLEHAENLLPIAGPTVELNEVLRWDISRQWVSQRWGRVTTGVAGTNYDGLRVALVSGTSPSDLCGSLTYYFDQNGQAQRIAFHGAVGDPQKLVSTLGELDFRRQASLGGELYTRSYFGNTIGVCRIRPAAVIEASSPLTQYEVVLEINRPGFSAELSPAAQTLLDPKQQASLW